MRQRVALARTLMEDRPVVLMDEPFSALDAITRHRLQDLAAELLAGRTVLLVTHSPLEALRLGHRLYVLSGQPGRAARAARCRVARRRATPADPALLAHAGRAPGRAHPLRRAAGGVVKLLRAARDRPGPAAGLAGAGLGHRRAAVHPAGARAGRRRRSAQPALLLGTTPRHAAEILLGIGAGQPDRRAERASCSPSPAAARRWLMPLLVVSQALPVFALAPLLVLWLGYGMASKVAMAVLIIYFPVTSAFFDGLRRTEPGWLELARTMDARRAGTLLAYPHPRGPARLGLGPAGRRRRGADRGRRRRVGRVQRRPRLPDAARQRAGCRST